MLERARRCRRRQQSAAQQNGKLARTQPAVLFSSWQGRGRRRTEVLNGPRPRALASRKATSR
eukprot:6209145-Pleurochrysis_carterae.AAC.1